MNGFYYLATPYSKYPAGHEAAYELACTVAAGLKLRSILVMSTFAHNHGLATIGGLGSSGFEDWQNFDELMVRLSDGIILVKAENWEQSAGIKSELKLAKTLGKPIFECQPNDLDTCAKIVIDAPKTL